MKSKFPIFILTVLLFLGFIALILTSIHKKPEVIKKAPVYKGAIAIVIDDWGYRLDNLPLAASIKQPLTCAVLPNLRNSAKVAQKLHNLGFEIMLHLPMQPKEKYKLEHNTITLGLDDQVIRNIIKKDLASVVFAKGVSNHMGSAITEDYRKSSVIMAEVKNRKLYFLDSYVTAKSVCQAIAKKIKVRFAKRNVFLDNQNDAAYIKKQLERLKNLSRKQGFAIGIGHDRKTTLAVLKEILPQYEKEGYKFVFVSEVAK